MQTDKVTRRNLTELVVANGKIQPVVQVKISPEVSGEIIELPVKEGQRVKKGDLLVKIKPDIYVASRNRPRPVTSPPSPASTVAEANLEKAEAEFKRNEELFQQQARSPIRCSLDFKTALRHRQGATDQCHAPDRHVARRNWRGPRMT